MKSRRLPRRAFLTTQLSLPLRAARITALDDKDRVAVIAVLARLLLEAADLRTQREGADDAE